MHTQITSGMKPNSIADAAHAQCATQLLDDAIAKPAVNVEVDADGLSRVTIGKVGGPAGPPDSIDLVAFGGVEYLCKERERSCECEAVRRGPARNILTVKWQLKNETRRSQFFIAAQGSITFQPGQRKVPIKVDFETNTIWSPETRMAVALTLPDEACDAVLGELHTTTIVVLCDETFPSGKGEPTTAQDLKGQLSLIRGFFEYARMLMVFKDQDAKRPSSFKRALLYKLQPCVSFIVENVCAIVLIDFIIEPNAGPSWRLTTSVATY